MVCLEGGAFLRGQLCGVCAGGLRARGGAFCGRCSREFSGNVAVSAVCARCLARAPAFKCAVAPFLFRGALREVVHQLKYGGKRYLSFTLAGWMAQGFADERLRAPPPGVLVPVPLHWRRRLSRGFNQAELLARALERLHAGKLREHGAPVREPRAVVDEVDEVDGLYGAGLRVENLLVRVRATGTQTELGRGERWRNLRGAFAVRRRGMVRGRHVLLVDDVLTTGATLDACARELLLAGAASVRALVVARG